MNFQDTHIAGLYVVHVDRKADDRGFFARVFDAEQFASRGLCAEFPEHSIAVNTAEGILRGLHYQIAPNEEIKLLRCVRGAIFDVILDVRKDSPTYGQWESFDLRDEDYRMLYVGAGLAHGYQTLSERSEVHYLISSAYVPEAARGIRWDDPDLAIPWPVRRARLSERDLAHPTLRSAG